MRLVTVINGVGSVGMFSSRAFVTAFMVAATLRWGPEIAWINNLGLLQQVQDVPTWFTHNVTLTILGILAALEIAATKSAEARAILNEVDSYLKSGSAFVTYLAVAGTLSANDVTVIKQITAGLPQPMQAGVGDIFDFAFAGATGIAVWFASIARARLMGSLLDADPDDDTLLQWLMSWAEDLFAAVGTLLLILYPPFMVAVTAIVLATLWLLELRARRREEKSQVDCPNCAKPMYRAAVFCPHCNHANPSVSDISWLGQSKIDVPTPDPSIHPQRLVQKQRCPRCAARLKPRKPRQQCDRCNHQLFEDPRSVEKYLSVLDSRMPEVLLITTMLSLIPVVGLIPGIIYYRQRLVSPVSRYTSMGRNIITRWGVRLFYFVLIWVQIMPVIGALVVPIMALISYTSSRQMFLGCLERARAKELENQNAAAQSLTGDAFPA